MRGSLLLLRPPEEVFDAALDEPTWNPAMTSVSGSPHRIYSHTSSG